MTQEKWFLRFSICLCLLIFFLSCKQPNIPPELPDFGESQMIPGALSNTLVARIYVDATLSMQGFVNPGSTRYTQILRPLESAITTGEWQNRRVEFFRFGTQVEAIIRNNYLQATAPEFYENTNINLETRIQEVIDFETQEVINGERANNSIENRGAYVESEEKINDSNEVSRLVIIVTDLFQQNSDINLLVNQLREKYIEKGFEIGLLGLRSHFDGTVYDTGMRGTPIPYQSDLRDTETFRPFYLLVLGRHADIAHYFDRLTGRGFLEAETVIFSRYLVESLASFEGALIDPLSHLGRVETLGNSQNSRLKQFRILRDPDTAGFSAILRCTSLPYAMSFDNSKKLKASVIAKTRSGGQDEESLVAQKCLKVTSSVSKNGLRNELTVDFSLTPRSLKRGIYLYEVILSPNIDGYRAPDWCQVWDMGLERDGSKTLNLVNFVRDLSQVTAQIHRPKIARFYCYIEKK